jgi:hypothetical protein
LSLATEDIYKELSVLFATGENKQMIRLTRNRLLKNRYALATVITTLIILVVSILLAGVLTYFAINVVSTRVQQESLSIEQANIWVPSSATVGPFVEGALIIENTGGRDVVINQIQVRGQPCTTVFYLDAVKADSTSGALAQNLAWVAPTTGGTPTLAAQSVGTPVAFTNTLTAAPANLVLPSGDTIVVYIASPGSVSINDIGLTIGFTVFTAQAMYYKETNVQAYTG